MFLLQKTSLFVRIPLLFPTDESPDQAALLRWLALSQEVWQPGVVWSGLAYQTLLTQGQQQSLSFESGVLNSGWLISLQERIGIGVINWWRALLSQQGAHDEQELLLDCLKRRDADAWINHLKRVAQRTNMFTESNTRHYSLEEVRTITEAMQNAEHIPLKLVLERERGTLRLVLCSLNTRTKEAAKTASCFRWTSPDPRLGSMIELRGGYPRRLLNLVRSSKALSGEGIAAEKAPPPLLQIEPARSCRNEDVMKSRMRFEPGARLQALVAREMIGNHENIAGRILRFNVGQQGDIVLRVARGGTSR
jgi:hypothetical protein